MIEEKIIPFLFTYGNSIGEKIEKDDPEWLVFRNLVRHIVQIKERNQIQRGVRDWTFRHYVMNCNENEAVFMLDLIDQWELWMKAEDVTIALYRKAKRKAQFEDFYREVFVVRRREDWSDSKIQKALAPLPESRERRRQGRPNGHKGRIR